MGQVLDRLRDKQWRRKQIRRITDEVFDLYFKSETGSVNLNFDDLYIGVLLVFNELNKRLPGPHIDPPSKDIVLDMMKENDLNLDGEIDREEFANFIKQLTADTFIIVSQGHYTGCSTGVCNGDKEGYRGCAGGWKGRAKVTQFSLCIPSDFYCCVVSTSAP
ncbi:unnamed protein product [Malus baccata var. baccata]